MSIDTPSGHGSPPHALAGQTRGNGLQDYRIGKLDAYYVFALDVPDLCDSDTWPLAWSSLIDLRGNIDALVRAFKDFSTNASVVGNYARNIQNWMEKETHNGGKAIWTDVFLNEEAPFDLVIDSKFHIDERTVQENARLSEDPDDPVSKTNFLKHHLKIYREGTFTYTAGVRINGQSAASNPPLDIRSSITLLDDLEAIVRKSFQVTLQDWLNNADVQAHFQKILNRPRSLACNMQDGEFRKRSRAHRLLFLDSFLVNSNSGENNSGDNWVHVDHQKALKSHAIAGLLNTAEWFDKYRPDYLRSLAAKNIGYRIDEIYITDRKASLASCEGFWKYNDPLQQYSQDLLLTVEYWQARAALTQGLLRFLQQHPTVRKVNTEKPSDALATVVKAQDAVARLRESMDPARLINHGFTTKLMERLRVEIGIDPLLHFIDERVSDAATSISLRSAVTAEGVVAPRGVKIAFWTLIGTIAAVVIAIVTSFLAGQPETPTSPLVSATTTTTPSQPPPP